MRAVRNLLGESLRSLIKLRAVRIVRRIPKESDRVESCKSFLTNSLGSIERIVRSLIELRAVRSLLGELGV